MVDEAKYVGKGMRSGVSCSSLFSFHRMKFQSFLYRLCYASMQDWRRRYFILKGSKLFFSKSPLGRLGCCRSTECHFATTHYSLNS
jgi:hypothetical protein